MNIACSDFSLERESLYIYFSFEDGGYKQGSPHPIHTCIISFRSKSTEKLG